MAVSTDPAASPNRFTAPAGEPMALDTTLSLPYTLTTGRCVGVFLAELANRRIVGSRHGTRVLVPAQDVCPETGQEAEELVVLAGTGSVTAFTRTAERVLAFIRLDGADADLLHRVLDEDDGRLEVGARVAPRWAADPQGAILDLEGFVLAPDAPAGDAPAPLQSATDPIVERPYELDLHYRHAYGPYYGRMFDELAHSRRIVGTRSPTTGEVLLPPRAICDAPYEPTEQWVDVADTGVIQAFSIIHLEFVGQTREPPYVYVEVLLDGAATRLIHALGGIDVEEARAKLKPGMRVRAVWRDRSEAQGTLNDIEHFELIEDQL